MNPSELHIPELKILEVDLDGLTRPNISFLSRIFGIGQTVRIERKIVQVANKLVDYGNVALRHNAPYKTGELRENFYPKYASQATLTFNKIAELWVTGAVHESSRAWKGIKPTNSWIAKHHDEQGKHQGWIERGQSEFNSFVNRSVI